MTMKILSLVGVSFFLLVGVNAISKSLAGEPVKRSPASSGTLTGANAAQMIKILEDAGITPSKTLVQGFDMICQGSNFQDLCMVSTQPADPAAHRLTIKSASSGQFWSLLKTAGIQQSISSLADGTAGQWVLYGNSVTCSLNSGGSSDECVIN